MKKYLVSFAALLGLVLIIPNSVYSSNSGPRQGACSDLGSQDLSSAEREAALSIAARQLRISQHEISRLDQFGQVQVSVRSSWVVVEVSKRGIVSVSLIDVGRTSRERNTL